MSLMMPFNNLGPLISCDHWKQMEIAELTVWNRTEQMTWKLCFLLNLFPNFWPKPLKNRRILKIFTDSGILVGYLQAASSLGGPSAARYSEPISSCVVWCSSLSCDHCHWRFPCQPQNIILYFPLFLPQPVTGATVLFFFYLRLLSDYYQNQAKSWFYQHLNPCLMLRVPLLMFLVECSNIYNKISEITVSDAWKQMKWKLYRIHYMVKQKSPFSEMENHWPQQPHYDFVKILQSWKPEAK